MKRSTEKQHRTSDNEIVDLFLARDEQAIALIHQVYGGYLLQVAQHFLDSREDCEECLNSTYLALWQTIPPSKPQSLLAFATQILRHHAINQWRSSQRKGQVPTELQLCTEELQNSLRSKESLEEQFTAREIGRAISTFLRKQRPNTRYLFIARYYLAEPTESIAKTLGCSSATIYRKLEQIRAELKRYLEQEGLL